MRFRRPVDGSKSALGPVRWLFVMPLVLLLAAQLVLAFYAWGLFKRDMVPEMDRKAVAVASMVSDKIAYALNNGVPFAHLQGVKSYFADILKTNPDLAFMVLTDAHGAPIDTYGTVPRRVLPALRAKLTGLSAKRDTAVMSEGGYIVSRAAIRAGSRVVGGLHVGVNRSYVDAKLSEIRFDLATVMLTSLLIAIELLLFVTTVNLSGPLRIVFALLGDVSRGDFRHVVRGELRDDLTRIVTVLNNAVDSVNGAYERLLQSVKAVQSGTASRADELVASIRSRYAFADSVEGPVSYRRPRLIHVRILTFLFTFSEMLSRPFMPIYVEHAVHPIPGIPDKILMGLPITVFMLVGAFGMSAAGGWIVRLGQRRIYSMGAVLSAIGLAGTGTAMSLWDLLLWRIISGIGYSMMFMACQAYLLENSDESDRAKSAAVFVGALMVAEICAPGIGGILADRVGFRLVFALGASVAAVSAILAWNIIYDDPARRLAAKAAKHRKAPKVFARLLRNGRFMALMLFAGIPAKMLLTGFLYFLVPLFLTQLGASQSEIGRIAMIWGVCSVVMGKTVASVADRYRCHGLLVGGGGLIVGLGLIPVFLYPDMLHVMLAVVALGVGQALSISPQLALLTRVCAREIAEVGAAPVVGRYRLIERIGSGLGPFVAATLTVHYGSADAITALGVFGASSAALFSLIFLFSGLDPVAAKIPAPEQAKAS
jgi:MFS family permease